MDGARISWLRSSSFTWSRSFYLGHTNIHVSLHGLLACFCCLSLLEWPSRVRSSDLIRTPIGGLESAHRLPVAFLSWGLPSCTLCSVAPSLREQRSHAFSLCMSSWSLGY